MKQFFPDLFAALALAGMFVVGLLFYFDVWAK
jgi:hypothetical protein